MCCELTTEIIDILESQDFKCITIGEKSNRNDSEYLAELEWFSDAGEDFIVTFWYDGTDKGLVDGFCKYAIDFDADEHAESWVNSRGKNGVPFSIRALIEDADGIQRHLADTAFMLNDLYYNGR